MEFHGWTEKEIAKLKKIQQEIAEHMKHWKPRFRIKKWKFITTLDEDKAFKFTFEDASKIVDDLNLTSHNNSYQTELNTEPDFAIISVYNSEYEHDGYVSNNPLVT